MDMQTAVRTVLSNYANFQGRSGRPEFWWWVLAYIIGHALVWLVGNVVGLGEFFTGIYSLALLLPSLAVAVRRLHDVNMSGWWVLLVLIPLIGSLALLFLCAQPPKDANQYGAGPQTATSPDP